LTAFSLQPGGPAGQNRKVSITDPRSQPTRAIFDKTIIDPRDPFLFRIEDRSYL
jgi:hypothetical protein